jgi:hypothetical protein
MSVCSAVDVEAIMDKLGILFIGLVIAGIYVILPLVVKSARAEQRPEVHEVLLSDGTRCALNPRGGITCNWRRK